MQLANAPDQLTLPWANAGGKNVIPVPSQGGGIASWTDGFPPATRTPIAAGGTPPSGLDMNGGLFSMSAIDVWLSAGGSFVWNSEFSATIGGYPQGAIVLRSDGSGFWINTVDANTTDPETGGSGWVPIAMQGSSSVALASSNVTLQPLQYARARIFLTGALTTNLNLIFPNLSLSWTIINNCTGAYSVTCKTAAGTGIAVPAGTSANVYGDGTNIYGDTNSSRMVASVYASTTQTINAGGGKVVFNTVEFDSFGLWNAGSSTFIALTAGKYRFSGSIDIPAVAPPNNYICDIYVNGAFAKRVSQNMNISDEEVVAFFSGVVNLNAGDYVDIHLIPNLNNTPLGSGAGYVFGQLEFLGS